MFTRHAGNKTWNFSRDKDHLQKIAGYFLQNVLQFYVFIYD